MLQTNYVELSSRGVEDAEYTVIELMVGTE